MTNRNRLRVALVSYNYGEYCVQLANALSQHAEVLLLIPDQTVALHMAKLGDSVRLFSFSNPRLRQPIQQFRSIRELYQKIDHFAPDVIHYQGAHLWFDLAFPLLHRYPRVFTIHDFKPHPGDRLSQKTPLWVEMFARRHAHELIVHTQFTRRLVLEEFPEFAEATSVIPHIQIGKTPWQSEAKEGEKLILFFGRIWEYKGLEYLVRAEPLITARVPDVRILIAGQGEDLGRYTRMMVHPERFTLDNKFISDERASDYFQSASVVVLPYIEASQSGVIPIAYTAAKPVVATMVGGLPEMVEDGRTGYLVAPRDTVQLANAVSRLLLDEPLRRRMGLNGKKKIEAECSPAIVAHKTLDVYRRAIERVARDKGRVFLKNSSAVTSRAGGGMD